MTQETRCPACGAPLKFSGQKNVVRCNFCGTDLQVVEDESGETRFSVLSQPEPQKEILSNPVIAQEPLAEDWIHEEPGAVNEPSPLLNNTNWDLPPAPSSGAQVYPAGEPAPAGSQTRKWVLIGVAVVLGLCVLCLCLIGVGFAVFGPAINS